MASWVLVPCGEQFRADLNRIAPNRSKASDGTIGDTAHQQNVSDHNDDEVGRVPIRDADSKHEVHAFDATADLREPGLTMEMVVQHTLARCRSGEETRLRYIIYRRRIWSASNGWKQGDYEGDSPHTEHAHFSFSYTTSKEADRSSWKFEEIPVALTEADKKWLTAQISASESRTSAQITAAETRLRAEVNAVPAEVLDAKTDDPTHPTRRVRDHLRDLSQVRDYDLDADNAKEGVVKPDSPLGQRTAAAKKALAE